MKVLCNKLVLNVTHVINISNLLNLILFSIIGLSTDCYSVQVYYGRCIVCVTQLCHVKLKFSNQVEDLDRIDLFLCVQNSLTELLTLDVLNTNERAKYYPH
jgi:hypothetical protein